MALSNVISIGEGAGCPFNPAVKARDDDGHKNQIGGVFWEMHEDIVCKQLPTVWYFVALPNIISTGEGEGCPL